jgi:hypothetical protein
MLWGQLRECRSMLHRLGSSPDSRSCPGPAQKRASIRRVPLLVVVLAAVVAYALVGCAGAGALNPSLSSVKTCLRSHGLRVVGGPINATAEGTSGADSELIVEDAFIVFYPSAAVAARHMNVLRANAERLRGSIIRRAAITVLFVASTCPSGPGRASFAASRPRNRTRQAGAIEAKSIDSVEQRPAG